MTEKGLINLNGYLSKSSYSRIKSHFYLFDTLYTFNFDEFKDLQLNSPYGKKSHLAKISLLKEQELIKTFNIQDFDIHNDKMMNIERYLEVYNLLSSLDKKLKTNQNKISNSNNITKYLELSNVFLNNISDFIGLKERLYSLLYFEKYNIDLRPTYSLDSYKHLNLSTKKSDIYRILIKQFPVPDDGVPLYDIIQYRQHENNRLNFLRLKKWVNNISKSGLTEVEITEEIECLIEENKKEMKLAGMKMKNARIEFVIKIIPSLVENLLKLKLSELSDPWFRLRNEKVSLLQTENNAKGNELSYILKA